MRLSQSRRKRTSNQRHELPHQIARPCSRRAKNPVQHHFKRGAKARLQILLLCKTSLTPCQNKVFTARQFLAAVRAESRETVTRWPRNVRQEIRRNVSHHIRAISRQWPGSGNGNAADCPSRQHARQLALRRMRTRHVCAGNRRDDSP